MGAPLGCYTWILGDAKLKVRDIFTRSGPTPKPKLASPPQGGRTGDSCIMMVTADAAEITQDWSKPTPSHAYGTPSRTAWPGEQNYQPEKLDHIGTPVKTIPSLINIPAVAVLSPRPLIVWIWRTGKCRETELDVIVRNHNHQINKKVSKWGVGSTYGCLPLKEMDH